MIGRHLIKHETANNAAPLLESTAYKAVDGEK